MSELEYTLVMVKLPPKRYDKLKELAAERYNVKKESITIHDVNRYVHVLLSDLTKDK